MQGPGAFNNVSGPFILTGPGQGIYVYSGTPALGNLIESVGISSTGLDPINLNHVLEGDTTYTGGIAGVSHATGSQQLAGGAIIWNGWNGSAWIPNGGIADNSFGQLNLDSKFITLAPNSGSPKEWWVAPSGDSTGATDSASFNFAFTNATHIRLMPGQYYVNTPLVPPSGCILRGAGAGLLELAGSIISGAAGFTGAALIAFPLNSQSQEISNLTLDGSLMPASTCECIGGISASHSVLSVKLEDLLISGAGFTSGVGNPNGGTTWRGKRIFVHGVSGIGFNMSNAPDSTWDDCLSLSAGQYGWRIQGSGNAKFTKCRGENSGLHGFYFTGISSVTGGIQVDGCSTDGNTNDGVRIDMTGACPISFTDLQLREDGKAGAGNFSFNATASATVPWTINGLKTFPGTNAGSTGEVPGGGINIGGAQSLGLISDAMVMATTTPITGMTAANNISWRNVWTNTGNPSAPGAWTAVADSA